MVISLTLSEALAPYMEPFPPPSFQVTTPCDAIGPVVVSSPHSGRVFPAPVLEALGVGAEALRVFDDGPIDQLAATTVRAGASLVAARYPRVVIDLNRDPAELDPELLGQGGIGAGFRLTPRARLGLGLVPSRIGSLPVWRRPLGRAEIERRLERVWRPYHGELACQLTERQARFGAALLLDLHSMPSQVGLEHGRGCIDVALGDRYGRTCAPPLLAHVERRLRRHGLVVARNRPYAGGYITERHGRPQSGRHALQLELRRSLFMDEATHVPHAGFAALQDLIGDLVASLTPVLLELGRTTPTGPLAKAS